MTNITINTLSTLRQKNEKITCLTVCDASFGKMLSTAGVEILLVGDSLGMVFQGWDSTVPVTLTELVYHTQCVSRGNCGSLLIADMPFMTYATVEQTLNHAAQLMQAGAHMVKLEGGRWLTESVRRLNECGIPVCAHIGLTPQSVHKIGGYKIQGREAKQAQQLIEDAVLLEKAGASLLVLECIPRTLAAEITQQLTIPTIGIGAGPDCSGQVLVLYDMLGISEYQKLKFCKNFMSGTASTIEEAIKNYIQAVKQGDFPAPEHGFD